MSTRLHGFKRVSTTHLQAAGDLWYFPPGIPHSLQATDDDPDGSEFLLVRFSFPQIPLAFSISLSKGL